MRGRAPLTRLAGLTLSAVLAGCNPGAVLPSASCVAEGSRFSARDPALRCCRGLTRVEAYSLADEGSGSTFGELPPDCEAAGPPDIKMCTRCGDGVCGEGENHCNCETDCPRESAR